MTFLLQESPDHISSSPPCASKEMLHYYIALHICLFLGHLNKEQKSRIEVECEEVTLAIKKSQYMRTGPSFLYHYVTLLWFPF